MKKRILLLSHGLDIGGAESSLIGYLHALSKENSVSTDLFLCRHDGAMMDRIPSAITLLPRLGAYSALATPIKDVIKSGRLDIAFGRFIGKRKATAYVKKSGIIPKKSGVALEYSHKYTKRFMPKISDTEYDLAVSFLTPHYFCAEKVNAKKKIAFVHTDYSYISVDTDSELKMWSAYDRIAAVSQSVKDSFTGLFPSLAPKVCVIENISDADFIRARSEEFVPSDEMPNDGTVKILSVGRFCDAKNFESIPYKAALLKKAGARIKWYIIGFGNSVPITAAIDATDTADCVKMLGKKLNPYPYMKRCDIYAQPSRYEGKALTVLEAQMLAKPVIISDYATARSQLEDGVDGIVAPMDDDGFVFELLKLINDEEKRLALTEACKTRDYGNGGEVKKLLELL